MSGERPNERDPEQVRADRLDDALGAWQRGEPPVADGFDDAEREPIGDELAAAAALARYGDTFEVPHEPLIALRAGLAARQKVRDLPRWRRLAASPRLAPTIAAVAAALLAAGISTMVRTDRDGGGVPAEVAVAKAQEYLRLAGERVQYVESLPQPDPALVTAAITAAQDAASRARQAAEFAPPGQRDVLLAKAEEQQRRINQLRDKLVVVAAPPPTAGAPTTTAAPTTTTSPPATTTTTVPPTTTTAAPTTTTSTAPATTTTAAPPTTTTTEAPPPPP